MPHNTTNNEQHANGTTVSVAATTDIGAAPSNKPIDAQAVALARLRDGELPSSAATNKTIVGELRMVPVDAVIVGRRYRNEMGDITGMAQSIRVHGLLNPITVDAECNLVSGYRRLTAHRQLGLKEILCHIVHLEDPQTAQLEEDRVRQPLDPVAMYEWTEALRERMTDLAWARRTLGKKIEDAERAGRVEDFLARHVGISRPTLVKIRKIMEAGKANPNEFGDLVEAMKREPRRIDRHYKALMERLKSAGNSAARVRALLLEPDWQDAMAADSKATWSAITRLDTTTLVAEGGVAIVPTSLEFLKTAVQAMSRLGALWHHSLLGTNANEAVWLVGTYGNDTDEITNLLDHLKDACEVGREDVAVVLEEWSEGSWLAIRLAGDQTSDKQSEAA